MRESHNIQHGTRYCIVTAHIVIPCEVDGRKSDAEDAVAVSLQHLVDIGDITDFDVGGVSPSVEIPGGAPLYIGMVQDLVKAGLQAEALAELERREG